MSYYVEHTDLFTIGYTVMAVCETEAEAQHVADWYEAHQLSFLYTKYQVVSEAERRGLVIPAMLEWFAAERQRKGYVAGVTV